jgi:hypothetical protein
MSSNNNSGNNKPAILKILSDPATNTIFTIIGIIIVIIGAPTLYSLIQNRSNNSPDKITAISSPARTSSPSTPQNDATRLNSSYNGTAYSNDPASYANGSITFTLLSEDQQGNVTMETTFQQLGTTSKADNYSCQGTVKNKRLNLYCKSETDQSYVLSIQGTVYPDNHLEGTEKATHVGDNSYNHLYNWKAF